MARALLAKTSESAIRPGHNAWRRERAGRAAVLVDAGQYFGAVREALKNARSTAFIVGWDLDSRTRLVDEDCRADDGLPEGLIDFLSAIVNVGFLAAYPVWSSLMIGLDVLVIWAVIVHGDEMKALRR